MAKGALKGEQKDCCFFFLQLHITIFSQPYLWQRSMSTFDNYRRISSQWRQSFGNIALNKHPRSRSLHWRDINRDTYWQQLLLITTRIDQSLSKCIAFSLPNKIIPESISSYLCIRWWISKQGLRGNTKFQLLIRPRLDGKQIDCIRWQFHTHSYKSVSTYNVMLHRNDNMQKYILLLNWLDL